MQLNKTCDKFVAEKIGMGCSTDNEVGYPKMLMYAPSGATITAVGDIPTPAEVQAFLNLGNAVIIPLTNGVFITPELQEISGADTYDGLTEVTREDNGVTAQFKKVTNSTLQMFAQNNLNNQRAQLWVIDNLNQLHGGKTGFSIAYYIQNFEHTGYGAKAMVAISHKWERMPGIFMPISDADADYGLLHNYQSEGTYVLNIVNDYVAGQVTGYNHITGWDKDTYPTIYLGITSNVISIYPTSVDRTADTNTLATVDSTTSLNVIEANSSGFGGHLDFVSNTIVDGAKWDITFVA